MAQTKLSGVNMESKFYKNENNEKYGFDDKEAYERYCIIKPEAKKFIEITEAEANPPPTQEQLIIITRIKYDKAIQKVCTAHLFNDINSARNLSTLTASPLQAIAKEITDWELEQQIIFIKLLEDAQQDIIELNASTFDDNFTQFEQ